MKEFKLENFKQGDIVEVYARTNTDPNKPVSMINTIDYSSLDEINVEATAAGTKWQIIRTEVIGVQPSDNYVIIRNNPFGWLITNSSPNKPVLTKIDGPEINRSSFTKDDKFWFAMPYGILSIVFGNPSSPKIGLLE